LLLYAGSPEKWNNLKRGWITLGGVPMMFYRPEDGWAGDFIPFHWNGEYHLFYLKDRRDEERFGRGMPWYHVGTRDFRSFIEYGEALPHGGMDEQDLYVFTGSVFEADGRFHIFYTGHNPTDNGKPNQAIMHAVSKDLVAWRKDPEFMVWADEGIYEADDWRDPFVFRNPETGEYWMLIAARVRDGPASRRGCTALAVSSDLADWEVREPFWAPGLYHTHECPDLFRWDGKWYLVYSTFTERFVTHYRMSKSLDGPWIAPRNDTFDGRAFYAAKTAGDGRRRFAFGWNPTREGEKDSGSWQWGGSLVVHEVFRSQDGSLRVMPPPELGSCFPRALEARPRGRMGEYLHKGKIISLRRDDGFAWCDMGTMPGTCRIRSRVSWREGTRACGLLLRASDDLDSYYMARIEPGNHRLVFDSWPRPGDRQFMIERPLDSGGVVDLEAMVEDTIMEVYAGGVAMSGRGYDHQDGRFGLFVQEGLAEFSGTSISGP
jgi:beta-fructofuranosidase